MESTSVEISEAKKNLIAPRTISRKHDVEERHATASVIVGAKTESKSVRDSISRKESLLQSVEQKTDNLYLQRGEKVLALEQQLEKLLVRFKKSTGIRDRDAVALQEEISAIETEANKLHIQSLEVKRELEELKRKEAEIADPKKLLEAYYKKIETKPLTNGEKREFLTPEALASLSTQEYIALWRRLNPYFLSHVTRQGFRDHNAMVYHSRGLKEFHNGFENILKDGKLLRPPLALEGLRTRDEASVRKFLSSWVLQAENEKGAKERLYNLLNFSLASAPKYPDETAVHFAAQVVADWFYGGERDNEVFFIFPADALASQYNFAFNGWEKDFTQPQSEMKWNDVFVWLETLDNPGISLDTGLVFLPESMPVDPDTGSKYASGIDVIDEQEKRVLIEDVDKVNSFVEWARKLDDQSPVKTAFAAYYQERDDYLRQNLRRTCLDVLGIELQKLGFSEDATAILANDFFSELHLWNELTDEMAQNIIRESGANWKRAEKTIPAKEYWENYFARNPQLRPKHIIYYDGRPTTAVYDFEQKNNIGKADTSEAEGNLLGFNNHHITDMKGDPRANVGYSGLVDMAEKIISDHYGSKKS